MLILTKNCGLSRFFRATYTASIFDCENWRKENDATTTSDFTQDGRQDDRWLGQAEILWNLIYAWSLVKLLQVFPFKNCHKYFSGQVMFKGSLNVKISVSLLEGIGWKKKKKTFCVDQCWCLFCMVIVF